MSLSFYCDKFMCPSEYDMSGVLGKTSAMWSDVKPYIEKYGSTKEEWKIYSQKAGWCKKVLLVSGKEERNIVFLYPNIDCFTCVLVFGEKAALLAKQSQLPDHIIDSIDSAKPYKEGRSFQVEVRTPFDYEVLKKLIDIKVQA